MIADKKGEQNNESKYLEAVTAIRKYFKNRISERKVVGLIEKTGLENVENQLKWLPHRDNSWARKGPVVAFIVYCEQQLEEPEALKVKIKEENKAEQLKQVRYLEKESFQAIKQREYAARRARYERPEQYDDIFQQIIEKLEPHNSPAKALLQSCFIGEVKTNCSIRTIMVDAPNGFSRSFLQSRYSSTASVGLDNLQLKFIFKPCRS